MLVAHHLYNTSDPKYLLLSVYKLLRDSTTKEANMCNTFNHYLFQVTPHSKSMFLT